jgi:hypothetical protein
MHFACFSAGGGGKVRFDGEMHAEEEGGRSCTKPNKSILLRIWGKVEIYYFLEEFGVRIFWYWDVGRLGD